MGRGLDHVTYLCQVNTSSIWNLKESTIASAASQCLAIRRPHCNASQFSATELGCIAMHPHLLRWCAMPAPYCNEFWHGRCIAHQLRGHTIGRRYWNSRDLIEDFCIFADGRLSYLLTQAASGVCDSVEWTRLPLADSPGARPTGA